LHVSDVEPAYYRHLEQGRDSRISRRDRGRSRPMLDEDFGDEDEEPVRNEAPDISVAEPSEAYDVGTELPEDLAQTIELEEERAPATENGEPGTKEEKRPRGKQRRGRGRRRSRKADKSEAET